MVFHMPVFAVNILEQKAQQILQKHREFEQMKNLVEKDKHLGGKDSCEK